MRAGAPLRLRSVRYKDGRAPLRVIASPTPEKDRADVERWIRRTLDVHSGRIAGYALVLWGPDNASTADLRAGAASLIPSIMIPDFVRNRLLAEKIEEWTLHDLNDA